MNRESCRRSPRWALQIFDRPAPSCIRKNDPSTNATNFPCACASAVPCEEYKPNPVLAPRHGPHLRACMPTMSRNASTPRRCGSPAPRGANPLRLPSRPACALPVGDRRHGGGQRGRAQDAGRRSAPFSRIPRNTSSARRTRTTSFPPDGLRPPGSTSNYDPARQESCRRTCPRRVLERARQSRTIRCSTSRFELERPSRCMTTISSRRSFYPQHRTSNFGHHPQGDGLPDPPCFHGAVRGRPARSAGIRRNGKEMIEESEPERSGPSRAQLYTGATRRDYNPISRRKVSRPGGPDHAATRRVLHGPAFRIA